MTQELNLIKSTKLDTYRTFFSNPIQLDFVLPGLLRANTGALIGPGGTGKSFLALQLATWVSSFGAWNPLGLTLPDSPTFNRNFPDDYIRVAYVSAEDPLVVIHNRIVSMAQFLNNDIRERVGSCLDIYSFKGLAPYLMYFQNGEVTRNKAWIESFKQGLKDVDLVFLDTLSRFHAVTENDNDSMKQVVDLFDEIAIECKCSIVFLHHSNKSAMREDKGDDQTASRGASSLTDNIRWQMNIRRMTKSEAESPYNTDFPKRWVLLSGSKINYAEEPDSEGALWLYRDPENQGVLTRQDPPRKEKQGGTSW